MRGAMPLFACRVLEAGAGQWTCGPALRGFPHILAEADTSGGSFFCGKKEGVLRDWGYWDSGQGSGGSEGGLWGSWVGAVDGAEPSMISSAWA